MAENRSELSFGRYLRGFREQRGMHLQEVSERTKIPVHLLRDLEGETIPRLPEAVYVKGFVRSYARVVGADPEEGVRLYLNAVPPSLHPPGGRRTAAPSNRRRFWPGLVVCMIGFAGIIFVSVWGTTAVKNKFVSVSDPDLTADTAVSPAATGAEELTENAPVAGKGAGMHAPAPSNGYLLDMKAVSDTRVRVTIDDHGPREYRLKKGDALTLKALTGFALHIENPAGVSMKLNGSPLTVEGKTGRPVKVKFP